MTTTRRVVAVVLALAAVVGCGVPRDDDPRPIPPGVVDPRLLGQATPTGTPVATGVSAFDVAFVTQDEALRLVRRAVSASPVAQQAQELLTALGTGPDERELDAGLSSALPPDVVLQITEAEGGVAVVAVEGGNPDADPRRLPLAVAQVVLTLTSHPGIDAVRLTRDGSPVEAPLPGGEVVSRPLTAADYRPLLAPPAAGPAGPPPTTP